MILEAIFYGSTDWRLGLLITFVGASLFLRADNIKVDRPIVFGIGNDDDNGNGDGNGNGGGGNGGNGG
jgi:hypothetical protein